MTDGASQPDGNTQKRITNIFLSALYKQIRLDKTDAEIFQWLQRTNMPPMSADRLRQIREQFKAKEQQFPEKMAKFRQMLKVP